VAAALSLDKFCMFIDHCREFLKSPELSFFFPAPLLPSRAVKFWKGLKAGRVPSLQSSSKPGCGRGCTLSAAL